MSVYKSSLTKQETKVAEDMIGRYYLDKRCLESIKKDMIPSPVQQLSLTAGCSSGGVSRSTENIVLRQENNAVVRNLEARIAAVDWAIDGIDQTDYRLIDMVYWRRSHNVSGAAYLVNISASAAYYHIAKILEKVIEGYVTAA